MKFFRRVREILAMPLILSLVISMVPVPSFGAENVSTDALIEESMLSEDRALVHEFMSREDVRNEMTSMGLDPDEAINRMVTLSDSEIQRIAGEIRTMPAGAGTVESVIGVAFTVFIILLITDLLCLTNVFNFTTCAR